MIPFSLSEIWLGAAVTSVLNDTSALLQECMPTDLVIRDKVAISGKQNWCGEAINCTENTSIDLQDERQLKHRHPYLPSETQIYLPSIKHRIVYYTLKRAINVWDLSCQPSSKWPKYSTTLSSYSEIYKLLYFWKMSLQNILLYATCMLLVHVIQ